MRKGNHYFEGIKDGAPIGFGYFSVSFSFGMLAAAGGLTVFQAGLISITNLTSAGQFAGLNVILAGASIIEMILTQLIINSRYSLMSLSLSQRLDPKMNTFDRALIAFFNTDEIFAVAMGKGTQLTTDYMLGLGTLPVTGWLLGTVCGAAARGILPVSIQSAFGLALYGMFIAIVVPPVKKEKPVRITVLFAILVSCMFAYLPILKHVSTGFVTVICTAAAAALGATFFPILDKEQEAVQLESAKERKNGKKEA